MNIYTNSAQDIRPRAYSENQANLIKAMMAERGITAAQLFTQFPTRPTTFEDASKVISWLKEQPKAATTATPSAPAQDPFAGVAPLDENGKAHSFHYALELDEGVVKFYRVKRGRKAGVWFVEVQASNEYFPIRSYGPRTMILGKIANDSKAALARYGQLIGRCGRCGRTLTSEYRELGIGPVCIDK